jgi:hypothetical protein
MATFKEVFGITKDHTLRLASQRFRYSDRDWTHEEYDAQGRFVARYQSWDYLLFDKSHKIGWRKLNPDGKLLEQHDDLRL